MAMDMQNLRERYETLDWTQQLGKLASTLARVSSRTTSPQYSISQPDPDRLGLWQSSGWQ